MHCTSNESASSLTGAVHPGGTSAGSLGSGSAAIVGWHAPHWAREYNSVGGCKRPREETCDRERGSVTHRKPSEDSLGFESGREERALRKKEKNEAGKTNKTMKAKRVKVEMEDGGDDRPLVQMSSISSKISADSPRRIRFFVGKYVV